MVGQADEAPAGTHGDLQEGIVGNGPRLRARDLHGEIDVLVVLIVEPLDGGEPHGHDEAAEPFAEIAADELQLFGRHLGVVDETDVLALQLLGDLLHRLGVSLGIMGVELAYLLDNLLCMFALTDGCTVAALGDAALARHAYSEELVEVVRVDAQEREPLQQWDMGTGGFLQDSFVEIHPADVSLQVGRSFLLLCHK